VKVVDQLLEESFISVTGNGVNEKLEIGVDVYIEITCAMVFNIVT